MKIQDFQRARVYTWCHEIERAYPKSIPAIAVTLLLERVNLVTGHAVTLEENRRASRWAWGGEVITMPSQARGSWAWTVPVVLHEASHVILKTNRICDQHGPRFVGLYLQLLKTCGGSIGEKGVASWAERAMTHHGIQIENMKHLVEHNVPSLAAYGQES